MLYESQHNSSWQDAFLFQNILTQIHSASKG